MGGWSGRGDLKDLKHLAAQQTWLISEANKTVFSQKPSLFGAQMCPEVTLLSLQVARPR